MQPGGAITSLEALKHVFFSNDNCPYWTFYYGFAAQNANRAGTNNQIGEMSESWAILEQDLKFRTQKGGRFLLHQTDKPRSSSGFKVKIDIPEPTAAAISGPPSGSYDVEARINSAVALVKKDFEIEQLRAQLEAKEEPTGIEGYISQYLDPQVVATILLGACSKLGIPIQPQVMAMAGISDQDEVYEAPQFEEAGEVLNQLSGFVGDTTEFLNVLLFFFENNEAIAINFYNQQLQAWKQAQQSQQ